VPDDVTQAELLTKCGLNESDMDKIEIRNDKRGFV
jgi:hypothetical protein